MADNYTPATDAGLVYASDDVGGIQFPVVKLDLGAGGASAPVSGSMPVTGSFVKAEDSAGADGDFGLVCMGQRRDSDTSAVGTDGDYSVIKLDELGRVKVSSYPASMPVTTVNITANAQSVGLDVSRYSNLMIHCTGTFSTVNVTFEGSLNATTDTDGNWFTVQGVRSNANTIETTTGNLSAAPAYAWELSVNALKRFRVRSTAWTSGTQVWTMQPGTYATEPIPAAQISGTQPVSFTQPALVAGTAAVGDVGIQVRANATGAASVLNYASPATPAGGTIKGSAGRLLGISLCNTSAGVRWLKVFNATSVTMGTTSAVIDRPIPVGGTLEFTMPAGIGFATGIMFAVTAARGVTDNTATGLALGDVCGFATYA